MKSTTQYFAQHQLKLALTQIDTLMRETLLQTLEMFLLKVMGLLEAITKQFVLFNKSEQAFQLKCKMALFMPM